MLPPAHGRPSGACRIFQGIGSAAGWPPSRTRCGVWLTPLRYQGKPIWVGQVSTTLGGRFAASGEETQRIEPDVDDARSDIVQDLLYSQALAKVGFVKGAGSVSAAGPRPTSMLRPIMPTACAP